MNAPRDWTRTLRRFAQSVRRAPLRNTIRRPSRRFGTYPGLRLRRTSRLAVVVDTSRSIEIPVLERFFGKPREEATRIMLHVHRRGVGLCGVFTYEVAETKVTQVVDYARKHQHPLQCTLERE